MKEILLFSSGIDSYIAWYYLNKPQTLYINMFHKYHKEEINRVKALIPSTIIKDLDLSKFEDWDADIPMRNLYLSMMALNMGYDKIWLSIQKEEMTTPDRSERFFKEASSLCSFLTKREIIIDTPFREMDKVDIVKWYVDSKFSVSLLKETWACYNPIKGEPCGDCGACFRRFMAFKLNKIEEPWFNKVYKSATASAYQFRAETGYYSIHRSEQIKESLNGICSNSDKG